MFHGDYYKNSKQEFGQLLESGPGLHDENGNEDREQTRGYGFGIPEARKASPFLKKSQKAQLF